VTGRRWRVGHNDCSLPASRARSGRRNELTGNRGWRACDRPAEMRLVHADLAKRSGPLANNKGAKPLQVAKQAANV
jgi:hypothetical protein